jgi:hypothetical protein
MPTVLELRDLLRARGLPVSGTKPELLARLKKKAVVATASTCKKSATKSMTAPKSQRGGLGLIYSSDYKNTRNLLTTPSNGFAYGIKMTRDENLVSIPTLNGVEMTKPGLYNGLDNINKAFLDFNGRSGLKWFIVQEKITTSARGRSIDEPCSHHEDCSYGNLCYDKRCIAEPTYRSYTVN